MYVAKKGIKIDEGAWERATKARKEGFGEWRAKATQGIMASVMHKKVYTF